ncbi:MAG: hypothetical protein ACOCP4_00405 [Candidatus Woesearchaeota archaeon]
MSIEKYQLDLNKVYENDFKKLYYLGKSKENKNHFLYGIRRGKPPFIYVEDNEDTLSRNRLEKTIRKIIPEEIDDFLKTINESEGKTFNNRLEQCLKDDSISKDYKSIKQINKNKDRFKNYLMNDVKIRD